MRFEINGVEFDNIDKNSISMNRSDDFNKSLSFMTLRIGRNITFGSDVKVYDNSNNLIYGGLVYNVSRVKLSEADNKIKHFVECEGYDNILSSETAVNFTKQNVLSGDLVRAILVQLEDYGVTEGLIEDGVTLRDYGFSAKTAMSIIDDCAEASGYVWWISDDKKLYFTNEKSVVDSGKSIDSTGVLTNSIRYYNINEYEDYSNYFNRIAYTYGEGNSKVYELINLTEINRLKALGVVYHYDRIVSNTNITEEADAIEAATKLLQSGSVIPSKLEFTTLYSGLGVSNTIIVNLPEIGINNLTYVIKNIDSTVHDFKGVMAHRCSCEIKGGSTPGLVSVNSRDTWSDTFKVYKKTNDQIPNETVNTFTKDLGVNNDVVTAIGTTPTVYQIDAELGGDGNVYFNYTIKGISNQNLSLNCIIKIDGVIYKSFSHNIVGNIDDTVHVRIPLYQQDAGSYIYTLEVSTSAGTFTINAQDLYFFIESNAFSSGISGGSPKIEVSDTYVPVQITPNVTITIDPTIAEGGVTINLV